MASMSLLCCIVVIFIASICTSASAAFVNKVEDFNGSAVDSTTWQPYFFGNGAATVANGFLDLSGQYYLSTRSLTIGVGTPLVARVMLTAPSSFGTQLFLGLTASPSEPLSGQTVFASLNNTIQGESDFTFFNGTNGSAGSNGGGVISNNVGNWYRILLQRNSTTTFTTNLLTDSGSLVSRINSTYSGLPAQASVFVGLGPTARFDWVAVPEPTSLALTILTSAALLRRPRPR
jgi:hypothetical protein